MPGQTSHQKKKKINHAHHARNIYNETFPEHTAKAQNSHRASWYRNPMHETQPVKYDPDILKLTSELL